MNLDPGVYPGVSFADYLAIDAINSSSLRYAARSMGHVRAALDGKLQTESDATKFGSLVHCLVLEPERFAEMYVLEPDAAEFRNKDGLVTDGYKNTSAYKAWRAAQNGRNVIDPAEHARATECAQAVLTHPVASRYLTPGGQREVVLVWVDEATGVRCKCRVDWLGESTVDLKTTNDLSDFDWSIGKWGYDFQGAFYRRGRLAVLNEYADVAIVAVESSGYPDVMAAPLDPGDIEAADLQIGDWLEQVRVCQLSGVWSGSESPLVWRSKRRGNGGVVVEASGF